MPKEKELLKVSVGDPIEIWCLDKLNYISQVAKVYPNGRFKTLFGDFNFRNDGTPITRKAFQKQYIAKAASQKTKDQMYRYVTVRRCRIIFDLTLEQARQINKLLDKLGISKAVFFGYDPNFEKELTNEV